MSEDRLVPLLVCVAVAAVLVAALLLFRFITKSPKLNTANYAERWKAIEAQFDDGISGQSLAVINADKLLDKAMQEKGFRGNTMGERLKFQPRAFGDMNAVWRAHKLRNRIAHDHSSVYESECRQALNDIHNALKNIGALV